MRLRGALSAPAPRPPPRAGQAGFGLWGPPLGPHIIYLYLPQHQEEPGCQALSFEMWPGEG